MQLAALDGLPAPPAVPQGSGDLAALGVATPAPADSGAAGRLRCCPCRGRAAGSRDDRRRPWQAGCCRCRAAGLATAASLIAMKQNNSHSRFACGFGLCLWMPPVLYFGAPKNMKCLQFTSETNTSVLSSDCKRKHCTRSDLLPACWQQRKLFEYRTWLGHHRRYFDP